MSLNAAVRPSRPAPEAPARTPRRTLQPVTGTPQRRRPKLAYALLAVGGALAITQDSFTLAGLTSQQHELDLRTDALQEDLTGMSSPQSLATSAAALGMVVAGSPAYLRLSDGAVFGQGTGAAGASTIDPTGAGAVGNALLNDVPVNASTADDATPDAPSGQSMQELPPAITDGLPSPSTR